MKKDREREKEEKELRDFIGGDSFRRTLRKSRRKQFFLYIIISILTTCGVIFFTQAIGHHIINNKIDQEISKINQRVIGDGKGAGIVHYNLDVSYGLFKAEGDITYYKQIGDRQVPWVVETKEFPVIGKVESKNAVVSEVLTVSNEERTVRYNQLNNEREIDFYYPHIGYHNLPNELEIALTLDENTLIEVALSFHKPMSKEEVWNSLGSDNVDWFWIDKSNSTAFNELPASEMDFDHVLFGENAYGFSVSNGYPSLNSNNSEKNILISGAIVSGTPSELARFLELDIIRASVIGLTMDNY